MLKSLICGCFIAVASLACLADEVSAADRRAVRAVVEAQLKALAADDSAQAFAHASPAIQKQFRDAATFMTMVRSAYPMVIRPAATSFFMPEAGEGVILQRTQFRDRDGKLWRALYELQRQPDKSWRINGCIVAPDDDASTT
jgi:Domain of unknown function (DUF4864)